MSAPRRAATVLVLRPAAAAPTTDIEVLFVRRGKSASFMANAYVFPGGRVDLADEEGGAELATRRCAARELREEANLEVGDLQELAYFARWITPTAEPRRFDADFFLWAMPTGAEPQVDAREVFDLRWYTPRAALSTYADGQLNLPPPTACTLEDLQAEIDRLSTTDAEPLLPRLIRACARRRPHPVMPKLRADSTGGLEIVLPWDPEFASINEEGEALDSLAANAAPVANRIRRCVLVPPGVWNLKRDS